MVAMNGLDRQAFENRTKALGIDLLPQQIEQFALYCDFLQERAKQFNLTAITQGSEIAEKHFIDCLLVLSALTPGAIADVGSGAGFPGLCLKIAKPETAVVLLEPNQKKARFLKEVSGLLKLEVKVVTKRAEQAEELRESFPNVIARAVAPLAILLELCVPLAAVGGRFVAMKGPKGEEEAKSAQSAAKLLAVQLAEVQRKTLLDQSERLNLIYTKDQPTPKMYPRSYGLIKRHPL